MILATCENGAIGINNNLIINIPNDLKRFKQLTHNSTVVMGRKTQESLPLKFLPNRRNIVISSNIKNNNQNIEYIDSINALFNIITPDENVFIIGGAQIYSQFINIVNKVYLTKVINFNPIADTYFNYDFNQNFKLINEEIIPPNDNFPYITKFITYSR